MKIIKEKSRDVEITKYFLILRKILKQTLVKADPEIFAGRCPLKIKVNIFANVFVRLSLLV